VNIYHPLANKTSQHILSTSATLLGFCLFIITSLHFANQAENTWIDEYTSIIALLLTISCVFSFISIRSTNEERELALEKIADYFFLFSLVSIMGVIAFIIIKFWQ
jgi:cytochrome bd-type quinol oxidase subunit 2